MKKIALILGLVLICTTTFAQKKWVKQKLTTNFSAIFPATPTKTASTTFAYKDSTSAVYTATYSEIAEHMKIDKKAFDRIITTNEFAEDFLNNLRHTLPQYGLEDILIKKERKNIIYLTNGRDEENERSISLKIIFADGIYYCLSAIRPNNSQTKNPEIFLNGYEVSKNR